MIICLFPEGQQGRAELTGLLEAEGYRVRIAALPTEPLVEETELAVVQLPPLHEDAVALVRLWREALPPGHPILALGAWREADEVVPLLEAGATDYLACPFQTHELAVRLLVLRGVTARLQEEFRRKIADAQRVDTLTALAGSLAHDFNNLLAAILGNAEVAMLDPSLSNAARYSLEQIDRASRHAAELTRQMMTYSGRGTPGFEAVSVRELVEDMGEILRASISRLCRVEYRFEPGLPMVLGDASQLRQVVMNLLINASEAMTPRGGVIRVSARTVERGGSRRVVLEVSDTGDGIPEQYRTRVFDPFFSTKRPGRGLGLAAVRSIVESHGGGVEVVSVPGQGATFRLDFPASPSAAGRTAGADAAGAGRGWGTVLLAEDEEAVREAAAHLLAHAGFRVLQAGDGQTAADLIQRHGRMMRVVVLDLDLPGLGGEKVLQVIRDSGLPLQVVIWTGYGEVEVRERTQGFEVAAVVRKPGHVRLLAAEINRVLEERTRSALAGGAD